MTARSREVNRNSADSFTLGFVKKRARQLIGRYGFREADREDVEQTLLKKLVCYLDQADPECPKWKAFVAKTIHRHIATLIRDRTAGKRDHRRTISLQTVIGVEDEQPLDLAAILQGYEIPSRRSQEPRSTHESVELDMDVNECIEVLEDERHRELCWRLMENSITQVAQDMNVPRTTIHSWICKIRSRFEEFGLANYLKK
ncbi:sigma-70 family RNA polymerase sigma factor [Bremerella sp. JC817]